MATRREYEHVAQVTWPSSSSPTLRQAGALTKLRRESVGISAGTVVNHQLDLAVLAAAADAVYLWMHSSVEGVTWAPVNNSVVGRTYTMRPLSRDTSRPWSAGQIPIVRITNDTGQDAIVTIEYGATG